jgi:hypothetical protein
MVIVARRRHVRRMGRSARQWTRPVRRKDGLLHDAGHEGKRRDENKQLAEPAAHRGKLQWSAEKLQHSFADVVQLDVTRSILDSGHSLLYMRQMADRQHTEHAHVHAPRTLG